ncbi:MAG: hypothetical protein K2P78_03275, partial [Gemmataceae bacterium]|nr:hypothetical protein [Gemmataceae bacterium]
VPVYVHDWFGPNRTALVVSTRSPELKADPSRFRPEAPLTGDESRVTEVKDVPFPQPLAPVDDEPPATVVTRVVKAGDALVVRGTTSDNGTVAKVTVNGVAAKATAANFAEWEATVPAAGMLTAASADAAGNVEKTPMVVAVK